jgi:muconolactone delta-isomerase
LAEQQRPGIRLCLRRARECERLAELAREPHWKDVYLRIAGRWRALAADQEFIAQMDALLSREPDRSGNAHSVPRT